MSDADAENPSRPRFLDPASKVILQLVMANLAWHRIRFLESTSHLKPVLQRHTGRTPSTRIAREVSACLQQGRLFYESAADAPLEIRPLLLYYGLVAFAKAVVVGITLKPLGNHAHSHGVKDVSPQGCKLRELRIKVHSRGTFHELNDAAVRIPRVIGFGPGSEYKTATLPSTPSAAIVGREWGIKDMLSRSGRVADLFESTFGEAANTTPVRLSWSDFDGFAQLIVDIDGYGPSAKITKMVEGLRDRYPFLAKWRCVGGQHYLGRRHALVTFANLPLAGEFAELVQNEDTWNAPGRFFDDETKYPRTPVESLLAPLAGGLGDRPTYAVSPLDSLFPSEFAYEFLVLFLLSSLVRYRPDTWAHALSRSVVAERPADDEMLALLELFMEQHPENARTMVEHGLGLM